jgi:hypothetical protein
VNDPPDSIEADASAEVKHLTIEGVLQRAMPMSLLCVGQRRRPDSVIGLGGRRERGLFVARLKRGLELLVTMGE